MPFEFGIKDIIDIVLVALLLYYIYRLMKESRSLNVFIGIMVFVIVWLFVSQVLEMRLLGAIMDKLVSVGVIGLIVLFQQEIRKFLYSLGAHQRLRGIVKFFNGSRGKNVKSNHEEILAITNACMHMARGRVGALIVIERSTPLDEVIDTGSAGQVIDGIISYRLIENIFFKNSPLHDGAMIISGRRLEAARCTLPITSRQDIPASYGMRHKAAIGITEETDADVIVVSEETGGISFGRNGNLQNISNINELKLLLGSSMSSN